MKEALSDPPTGSTHRPSGAAGPAGPAGVSAAPAGVSGWLAIGAAGVALALTIAAAIAGGWALDVPWAPTLGLRLHLELDGLAVLYALLATGIGLLVFVYATGYMPRHLRAEGRPAAAGRRFWVWMVVFMAAMVGLAASQDLILLFVFFDLTAIASYFLIGFDRHLANARGAALVALVVTTGSAVAMLLGAVILNAEYGTFSIPELLEAGVASPATSAGCVLIAVAALAKSAQVPLHFWLPRAMAAPTPVSAYLHSAAMVAAGVLVLGRIHPLLALDQRVLDGLVVAGFASIFVGGVLALAQDELKQVLANSTISQYGYVVVLYGLGGEAGAAGAAMYVLAHAVAKSALFMTAGYVTEATGESGLSRLGGLWRDMPVVSVAAGIAAASLAAFPITLGFFKDELFFAAASAAGPVVEALAIAAAALTLAYIGRFWLGVFAGGRSTRPEPVPRTLAIPIVLLAAITLTGGIVVGPFAALAEAAASVIHGAAVTVAPAYHLDARVENLMAVSAWTIGLVLLLAAGRLAPMAGAVARLGDRIGPRRLYGATLDVVDRISESVHRAEVRDLRTSLAAILVPTGILAALGFAATPTDGSYIVGPLELADAPLIGLLLLAVLAAVTVTRDSGRLRPVLALSVLGFALAGVYAIIGAPDVALVAVVIETVLSIVFVAVFARLPATAVSEPRPAARRLVPARLRSGLAGVIAGVSAFAVIWSALSRPPLGEPDYISHIELTPRAHGGDVVTVILADFRGLDTMVEITVLFVAIVGVVSLLRRRAAE
ncbi:MAG TPA: hydrogen gas-evolving membrane-bound hydrogenase subunit E [Candidatus Limnocylindrales bacterium]|nr:hydrogen gas-evolving membrane-bound hydrogenase subunit E [Candidatus Limnocylindrales bacterium]